MDAVKKLMDAANDLISEEKTVFAGLLSAQKDTEKLIRSRDGLKSEILRLQKEHEDITEKVYKGKKDQELRLRGLEETAKKATEDAEQLRGSLAKKETEINLRKAEVEKKQKELDEKLIMLANKEKVMDERIRKAESFLTSLK